MATEPSQTQRTPQVSPELVLIDPGLAAAARDALVAPDTLAVLARPRAAGLPPAIVRRPQQQPRSRANTRVLVGVAAVLVLTLLLADVRVEVGRNRAAAEPVPAPGAPAGAGNGPLGASPPPATKPAGSPSGKPTTATVRPDGKVRPRARGQAQLGMRRLAWAPVANASAYRVELFRGAERVFVATTVDPQLNVPARWTIEGRPEHLTPGEYRWYVWPVVAGQRQAQANVQASLVVS